MARLMCEYGLRSQSAKKFRVTMDSRHNRPVAENTLNQEFSRASGSNEVWLADITYIPTDEGWLYLATVEDLYTRKIVGWSMSERMKSELVTQALTMAVGRERPDGELLHHSDRGSQYCSEVFGQLLKHYGIDCSMSRKGNCWEATEAAERSARRKPKAVDFSQLPWKVSLRR